MEAKVVTRRDILLEWLKGDNEPNDPFQKKLVELKTKESITIKEARKLSCSLKKLANGEYKVMHCYDAIAVCFGYSFWADLLNYLDGDIIYRKSSL